MDDLNGLSWTSSTTTDAKQKPPPMGQGSFYPTLRPTPPLSRRSTPFSAPPTKPATPNIARSNASTPANDSFANLVSFNAANSNKGLSLSEQQKRLQEERDRQGSRINGSRPLQQDEEFWEKLGSGRSTPNPPALPPTYTATEKSGGRVMSTAINKLFAGIDTSQGRPQQPSVNGNDLLADIDTTYGRAQSKAKITSAETDSVRPRDNSSHPPSAAPQDLDFATLDDDDPFGLGSMGKTSQPPKATTQETTGADDDILGLLGRPVSEFARPKKHLEDTWGEAEAPSASPTNRALAELVDMGFSADKSRQALSATESGADVQAAVGWLLNQAHQESRSQSTGGGQRHRRDSRTHSRNSPPRERDEDAQPVWMRDRSAAAADGQRQNSRSPVNGEKDPAKIAAELGSNLFKTANSLWKTGQKKLNRAVADFNSDSDSSQPKWMSQPSTDRGASKPRTQTHVDGEVNDDAPVPKARRPTTGTDDGVTDEALMLESADTRPPPRKPARRDARRSSDITRPEPPSPVSHTQQREPQQPKFLQQSRSREPQDPRGRLSKQAIDEQTTEAYVSPARRRRTAPKPPSSEADLLSETSQVLSSLSVSSSANSKLPSSMPSSRQPMKPPSSTRQPANPPPKPRPQPPKRSIPPISPAALKISHTSRQAGSLAFKRGDYAEATTHYTSALTPLPATHPLHIPLLTNRALSHLKTGDPKACLADTTSALDLIGPSRGTGEVVDLGTGEGVKDMFAYWGKAMTRQAEALEQLEKWADAGSVWKTCVEAGVGAGTSIAGRNRCEQALRPQKPAAPPPTKVPPKPKPKPQPKISSALDDLSGVPPTTTTMGESDSIAVTRLRLANLAADRLDDEKFALADSVAARVSGWRAGKEGNLRALLASLDQVLWEGSGWKRVGMGELLVGGKVKGVYVRAVGRVHPDKLPTTATTEQRMVSAAVFATLNEAWDGFKRENGL
ncbi:MAG: hypothetical protein LQ350_006417 [Teloschistes chrysophthalmus]|nr:MAG: hypothetical protein LQ350_006417 [Niorma chrysophthalma]